MNELIDEKTYDEIYAEMAEQFKEESGYDADNASDIGIRMRVLAGQIYSANKQLNQIWKQAFPDTASGEYLDYHAYQRGMERREATAAAGTVVFTLAEAQPDDIELEKGTVVATGNFSDSIKFTLEESLFMTPGDLSVSLPVKAVETGTAGNIPAGAIKVIEANISAPLSVTNEESFTGGTVRESDESLRKRIVEAYQRPVMDANENYFKSAAMSFDEIISAAVIPKARGTGTVDIAVETADRRLPSALVSKLNSVFRNNHEFGCDVAIVKPEYTATDITGDIMVKNGFSAEEILAECENIIREKLDSLCVGDGLIIAELYHMIMGVEGVKNVSIFLPQEDVPSSPRVRLVPGTIAFNIVR